MRVGAFDAHRFSCSRATASLARQHFLHLLPLPLPQGSLRPGLAMVVSIFAPEDAPL
jgi:hypothetical protein